MNVKVGCSGDGLAWVHHVPCPAVFRPKLLSPYLLPQMCLYVCLVPHTELLKACPPGQLVESRNTLTQQLSLAPHWLKGPSQTCQ